MELNFKFVLIVLIDFQNAVKAQDTANANDSLVIHNMITNIRTDLDNLKSVVVKIF